MKQDSKKGKIHIITHPLQGNYGGMLQAYAMQKVVNSIFPDTCQIAQYKSGYIARPATTLRERMSLRFRVWRNRLRGRTEKANQLERKLSFMTQLPSLFRVLGKNVTKYDLTPETVDPGARYIVGSDQVWRCQYARIIKTVPFYFLDFASEERRRESIAYAASFGSDRWEGTKEQAEECGRLLRQFKAVSVREHSAIQLCRDLFGVEAVQMPDPTLLLQNKDYDELIDAERTKKPAKPYIVSYQLDKDAPVSDSMEAVSKSLGMPLLHLNPGAKQEDFPGRLCHSVSQWVRYMRDAEYVLTDSFHGCVFALIFNKPFVCYGNESRGTARFDSLMQMFHLEARMVTRPELAAEVLKKPIDWNEINGIRAKAREMAMEFIRTNLS